MDITVQTSKDAEIIAMGYVKIVGLMDDDSDDDNDSNDNNDNDNGDNQTDAEYEESGDELKVEVEIGGDADNLCLYADGEAVDCKKVDGAGTVKFTTDNVRVGEEFGVCSKYTGKCEYGENGEGNEPERISFD
jgi:hypothetical protein